MAGAGGVYLVRNQDGAQRARALKGVSPSLESPRLVRRVKSPAPRQPIASPVEPQQQRPASGRATPLAATRRPVWPGVYEEPRFSTRSSRAAAAGVARRPPRRSPPAALTSGPRRGGQQRSQQRRRGSTGQEPEPSHTRRPTKGTGSTHRASSSPAAQRGAARLDVGPVPVGGDVCKEIAKRENSTAEPPRSIRSSVRGCMPTSQAEVTGCGAFGSSARYTATSLLLLFGHSRPKPSSLHSVPMACSRVMMLATRAPGGHDLVALGSSVARPAPTGCWAALW